MIDTGSYDAEIDSVLTAIADFTKIGAGVLTSSAAATFSDGRYDHRRRHVATRADAPCPAALRSA